MNLYEEISLQIGFGKRFARFEPNRLLLSRLIMTRSDKFISELLHQIFIYYKTKTESIINDWLGFLTG